MGKKVPLHRLPLHHRGRIIEIKLEKGLLRRHLLEMGFTRGTIVEIIRIAPLGDPMIVSLRGYAFCMRKEKLQHIVVEVTK